MLKIRSRAKSFWRCGVRHTEEPTKYKDDDFSKDELEILKNESELIVEHVEDEQDDSVALEDIVKAIGNLSIDDKESWTNDGAPQVKALGDILSQTISAKDRDAAWKVYQESKDSQE